MFGNKKAKQESLDKAVDVMRQKGVVTQTELARELDCSLDAVEDYLASLEQRGDLLCQNGRKISLLEHWFGKK